MKVNCNKYQVIPGEPQLGKVEECTYTFDREEILEALVEAILEDSHWFQLGDFDDHLDVSDWLSEEDLELIRGVMERELLDDDYGSGKDWDLVYDIVDKAIPYGATHEFETQEYR